MVGLAGSRLKVAGALTLVAIGLAGCASIKESRGFIADPLLANAVAPGIDNQRSVEGTLGRPTFTSQFGEPTWYYVATRTGRGPFRRPKAEAHSVIAVQFDDAGNVSSVENSGIEDVVFINPDGDKTPTLGRERSFLEDLFGNIGSVGAPGVGGGGPGGP